MAADETLPGKVAGLIERALLTTTELGVLTIGPDGALLAWNWGARRMFLYEDDALLGQPALVIFTPEDRVSGAADREIAIAAAEGKAPDERWHLRSDGSRFWASGLLLSVRDEAGVVQGFVKVIQDRTSEKRIEESLRHQEEQFARLFLGNPGAIAVEIKETGRFMIANERFLQLIGYWRADAMGKTGDELGLWADRPQRNAALKALEKEDATTARIDVRAKDGQVKATVAAFRTTTLAGQECVVGTYIDTSGLFDK